MLRKLHSGDSLRASINFGLRSLKSWRSDSKASQQVLLCVYATSRTPDGFGIWQKGRLQIAISRNFSRVFNDQTIWSGFDVEASISYNKTMPNPGLLNDILFKIVFGAQNSEPVLTALLNALLGFENEQKIVTLTIENPTLDKEYITDKGAILDLKAVDGTGRWYNIEVQLEPGGPRDYHTKRSIFYLCKLYTEQLGQGASYNTLTKTIHISLLDFLLFKTNDRLHNIFHFRETESAELLTDIIELHYIELKKFSLSKPHHLRTSFEKWLYFLKFSELYIQPDGESVPDILMEEEGIPMAMESLQKAYARDEVREMIRARENARIEYRSRMELATQQGLEQGREIGLEQGREIGLVQGREIGIEQGLEQQRLTILDLLGARFQELPPELALRLKEVKEPEKLRALILASATASDVDGFLANLP